MAPKRKGVPRCPPSAAQEARKKRRMSSKAAAESAEVPAAEVQKQVPQVADCDLPAAELLGRLKPKGKGKGKGTVKAEQASPSAADRQLESQAPGWQETPKSQWARAMQRAARAAFDRSINADPKVARSVKTACPAHMKAVVHGNPDCFFGVWAEKKGKWLEVELELDMVTKQTTAHSALKEWLRKDQMEAKFPKEVADGKMAYLKTVPGSFKVDPECPLVEAGWMWHVTTKDEDALSDERMRQTKIAARATLNPEDSDHRDLVAGVASTIDGAVIAGTVIQLPEEKEDLKELTEEEKRKAAEAEAARQIKKEAKANDPIEKGKKWLSKLPSDQAQCLALLREANSAVPNMRESLRLEYVKIFTDALESLTAAANKIQGFLANPKDVSLHAPAFEAAHAALADFRKEKKSWEGMMAAVNPKAKAKSKAAAAAAAP